MATVVKYAQERSLASSPSSAASSLPTVEIQTTFAPGKRGPTGMAPRTNYSRVNTGSPPTPDVGVSAQKAVSPLSAQMLPEKVASSLSNEESMVMMTQRPRLQDMVKAAMATSLARVDVGREASRQAEQMGEKTAADTCPKCKKALGECSCAGEKKASSEYALKLANAVDYIVSELSKEGAHLAGPWQVTPHITAPPEGVMQANASERSTDHQGQGHHVQPMNPGTQKGLPTEQGQTLLANNAESPPGGRERMIQRNQGGKTASVIPLIRKQASVRKTAEDAINPAQISAGAAVPPETVEAGEAGKPPAAGPPQGPTNLVSSNESAQNYDKGQAYANRKQDLGKYFNEPALSSATDKTLSEAFTHTPEAGTKFSSAMTTKTAAARALLAKLAEQAEQRSA